MKASIAASVAGLLLVLMALQSAMADFSIQSASAEIVNDIYMVDAEIDYAFSNEALEALNNGVNLIVKIEVEIQRKRKYLWDPVVARTVQTYRLERHELSDRYLVVDATSGTRRNFTSISEAVESMGSPDPIPVIERESLESSFQYTVRLRTALDIEELPAPLRPIAYISPNWRLGSDWHRISLKP